ncbi:hypothetical protein BC830DRAFT_1121876 [Chytriomyces sp. MP71]|nr:hypothetical protein BC830DRAFT_1121876 [Chytriomyces sp. MP71]
MTPGFPRRVPFPSCTSVSSSSSSISLDAVTAALCSRRRCLAAAPRLFDFGAGTSSSSPSMEASKRPLEMRRCFPSFMACAIKCSFFLLISVGRMKALFLPSFARRSTTLDTSPSTSPLLRASTSEFTCATLLVGCWFVLRLKARFLSRTPFVRFLRTLLIWFWPIALDCGVNGSVSRDSDAVASRHRRTQPHAQRRLCCGSCLGLDPVPVEELLAAVRRT